jgi:hypothetical protein
MKLKQAGLALCGAFAAGAVAVTGGNMWSAWESREGALELKDSVETRVALSRATIQMSLERSITQVGLGLPSALPDRFRSLLDGQRDKVDGMLDDMVATDRRTITSMRARSSCPKSKICARIWRNLRRAADANLGRAPTPVTPMREPFPAKSSQRSKPSKPPACASAARHGGAAACQFRNALARAGLGNSRIRRPRPHPSGHRRGNRRAYPPRRSQKWSSSIAASIARSANWTSWSPKTACRRKSSTRPHAAWMTACLAPMPSCARSMIAAGAPAPIQSASMTSSPAPPKRSALPEKLNGASGDGASGRRTRLLRIRRSTDFQSWRLRCFCSASSPSRRAISQTRVSGRISALSTALDKLAGGDLDVDVTALAGTDEIGDMVRATQVFKDNAQCRQADAG